MRKLKLYNFEKTSNIDLNINKHLVSDISGLGTTYEFKKLEKSIYDIDLSFENISFEVIFGINSNAYNDYKSFLDFVIANGKKHFILSYDYGSGERFTNVYLKNAPKSQKTNFNVISENIVFERLTPWYLEKQLSIPGSLVIANNHFMEIPLYIRINAKGTSPEEITITVTNVATVKITSKTNYDVIIDSNNQEVYFQNLSGNKLNAYDAVNHNFDTFIWIPKGNHSINITGTQSGFIKYMEWIAD